LSGDAVTIATDKGSEVQVQAQRDTRILRTAPGSKNLKDAQPITLKDLQVGDRILAHGSSPDGGKSLLAATIIAMKHTDIAQKQQQDLQEWQHRGVAGLVKAVDVSAGTISISTMGAGGSITTGIRTTANTLIRRYAPDSIKFDEARKSSLLEIKPGDQVRARGDKRQDGTEFVAEEIVSGTFRNIAGTITAVDAAKGTVTVNNLADKTPVVVSITSESQIRNLPPAMAQHIAARLKPSTEQSREADEVKPATTPDHPSAPGPRNPADMQQILMHLPPAAISDLHKGEAVMIVATEGSAAAAPTAITLLSGVEPILTASPSGRGTESILSPWNLGSGAPDTGGTQ
jgi:hypothetical protein